jgi:hypothetical protein
MSIQIVLFSANLYDRNIDPTKTHHQSCLLPIHHSHGANDYTAAVNSIMNCFAADR